jgi:hypothetical protein
MRTRTILWTLAFLALVLWVGLLLFMNRKPPEGANQAIFVLILGAAVACTGAVLFYPLNVRRQRGWGRASVLGRAVRQGAFLGILAAALVGLRLLQSLNVATAAILSGVFLALELAFLLKSR